MTDSGYVYGVPKTGGMSAPVWSSELNSNWESTKRLWKHSQPEKTYNRIMKIFCLMDLQEECGDLPEEIAADTTWFDTARSHPVSTTTSIQARQRSLVIGAVGSHHPAGSLVAWSATTLFKGEQAFLGLLTEGSLEASGYLLAFYKHIVYGLSVLQLIWVLNVWIPWLPVSCVINKLLKLDSSFVKFLHWAVFPCDRRTEENSFLFQQQ